MTLRDTAWLEECPAALRLTMAAYVGGGLPPAVALMRLLMDADSPARLERLFERMIDALEREPGRVADAARLRELCALWRSHPDAAAMVASVLDVVAHDAPLRSEAESIVYWRDGFDRAVRISPEASVALYSLGDPELLAAATHELIVRMADWGLLGRDRRALDVGCGTGRVALGLATRVRSVVGVDISHAMLDVAQRRSTEHRNVSFVQVSGRDLGAIADASIDLALAFDSFPYLVQSGQGLAERHVYELARVLAPGGNALIANFSYRGDPERDRADVARFGSGAGLRVVRNGTREFTVWDGLAFHLFKPDKAGTAGRVRCSNLDIRE